MHRKFFFFIVGCTQVFGAFGQNSKSVTHYQQVWISYSNITRFSNKLGAMLDLQVRTKDHFTEDFSSTINSIGLNYYLTEATRATAGYTYAQNYADGARTVTVPEHRPFQQVQWTTRYRNKRMLQWVRLEERFRRKLYSNTKLDHGYTFNFRVRYNFFYDLPLSSKGIAPHAFSLVLNDELHINLGKQIVLNTFDQNRFSCAIKYQFSATNSLQVGYVNLFQQLTAGNRYRTVDAGRIAYLQNLDLRTHKPVRTVDHPTPQ